MLTKTSLPRLLWSGVLMTVGLAMHFGSSARPCQAQPETEVWTTDAAAAAALAEREGRDLLLLFTGSDWCPPCIKLEQQILSQAGFLEKASQHFVLVKLDFPQKTPLPDELQKQNDDWAGRFGIEGFPTLALLDRQGRPFAFTGFRDEGPDAYLAHLLQLQQARQTRDELLQQASQVTGLDRANLLDQALSALEPNIVEVYYPEIMEEIGELDKDDEQGLRTKYFADRDREIRKAIMSSIAMVTRLREPAEAVVFIDETLANNPLPVDLWLQAQSTKLRLLRQLERVDDSQQLIDSMIGLPDLESDTRQRLIINKSYYLVSLGKPDEAVAVLDESIAADSQNLLLSIAKGELFASLGKYEQAIQAYDQTLMAAAAEPQLLMEVCGAKSDALVELGRTDEALTELDKLIANEAVPGRLRAEALLHRALILREDGRRRAAILSENKAVEIVESVKERAEIQKLVDQFRRKFEKFPGRD